MCPCTLLLRHSIPSGLLLRPVLGGALQATCWTSGTVQLPARMILVPAYANSNRNFARNRIGCSVACVPALKRSIRLAPRCGRLDAPIQVFGFERLSNTVMAAQESLALQAGHSLRVYEYTP